MENYIFGIIMALGLGFSLGASVFLNRIIRLRDKYIKEAESNITTMNDALWLIRKLRAEIEELQQDQ